MTNSEKTLNMNEPSNNKTTTGGLALISCLIAALVAGYLVATANNLLSAWVFTLLSLALFTFACGQKVTGRWMGALVDDRNVMSLSRFQIVLWTLLVLSAYLVAAMYNISLGRDALDVLMKGNPLSIGIQQELWWLMGISTVSLVGSPLILGDKASKVPDATEVSSTFKLLEKQGDQESTLDTKGHIVVNTDISKARWSDMFTGEEVGNAAHLDVARLQMFFFTLITAIAYAALLSAMFSGDISHGISSLPALDKSMIALIAISHTGYLTAKAVSHSQIGIEKPTIQPAAVADEHPAVG